MEFLRRGRTRAEFEQFVADHSDRLLRTGYLLTMDLAEAEDLVQECLVRLAKHWPRVRTMDRPDAYARRVLANLVFDGTKRRTRRRGELDSPDALLAASRVDGRARQDVARVDTRAEIFDVLSALPYRQRTVLVLRYFEDLSEAQVAEALGCSLGTVKSTNSRGLARLRAALEDRSASVTEPRRDVDNAIPPKQGVNVNDRAN